jgi:anti-sigma-K factor RskA
MGLRRTDPHTLAGAYAMDSVSPSDRAAFEQHLAGCEPCRQEIRGLREATARLAGAVAVQPPPGMRDAALAAAAQTRQLPPAVRAEAGPWPARAAARGRWLPRLALGLAGALAAVAIVLGVAVGGAQHRLDQAQLHTRAIATVLNAADATMLTAKVSTGGTATVVMSHRERALVFTAAGLQPLPAAEGYELWLMGPGGDRGAGMMAGSRPGSVGPMVVSGLASEDRVGLTVEPAGGSPRPTSAPVLMLDLGSRPSG